MGSRSIDSRRHAEESTGDSYPSFRLEPETPAGERFAELAAEHAELAAEHADRHDREGTFPFEVFDAMRTSGFLTATVPEAHGGLGLDSVHDLTVGLCDLGRADGSTSIAANMHLAIPLLVHWLRGMLTRQGTVKRAERLDAALEQLGRGCIAMGNVTEMGTDIAHPLTEAGKVPDGWLLNGSKTFGTLAPVADWFVVSCRVARPDKTFANAYAVVPRGCSGQEILDNWDSLGMRASGSHDISYTDCFVPANRLLSLDRDWGVEDGTSQALGILGNIPLLGTFLGIAEAARDHAVETVKERGRGGSRRPTQTGDATQRLVAEMDIALACMRAVIERTTFLVDRFIYRALGDGDDLPFAVGAQFQSAKLMVNGKAIDVVDQALTLTGGAGYMSGHPLSRLYRDVRAGPFMQPYSPKEAYGYIARPALGLHSSP